MASLPDDNRFLLLKGLRQTLHLAEQDESSTSNESRPQASDTEAENDKGDETQKLKRRSDRARATSAVGLGCHIDLESAVLLPAKLEALGKALTLALDEAADARPAFQALVEVGYSAPATAPVTSQFILRRFANDLSSLSKLVTSETLLAELRQGSSLLAQAMALRWDLTGETRALQQLANAFVATKSELTNATAAEFGLALATAIALSQPELADRLLGFASEHIADDTDPGLIRDALHCMDAGRLLQTMPAVIQSVWQQRLRFADRDWNWDTTESRRVLNSLSRVIRPDSLSLPLFKRIVPEDQWAKMSTQGETALVDSIAAAVEDPQTEEFTLEEVDPVLEVESEPVEKEEPEPVAERIAGEESESAEKLEPVAEQVTAPDETNTVSSDASPDGEVMETAPPAEAPKAEKTPEPLAESDSKPDPGNDGEESPTTIKPEAQAGPVPSVEEPKTESPSKPAAPASKAKLTPKADGETTPETPPPPVAAEAGKPAARSGFLTFLAGAVGGLLVAFAVWAALPAKLQTLASAADIATEASPSAPQAKPVAPKNGEKPASHADTATKPASSTLLPPPSPVKPAPAPVAGTSAKLESSKPSPPPVPAKTVPPAPQPPPAPVIAASPQPSPAAPVATTQPSPAPTPAPVASKPQTKTPTAVTPPASTAAEMVGPPQSAAPKLEAGTKQPPSSTPPPPNSPEIVSKPLVTNPFEIWKQKQMVEMISEHPMMKDWAFTAQNRNLRDSTHLIVGKHPLIPHKSKVHQSLLTLLVLDPPKDPDAARASLNMFSRVCSPMKCLEIWEPMVEAKVPQSDDIRRAAGVMVELMSLQLTSATRQRLERLANGK